MERTSAQPQVGQSLLRSNSLKFCSLYSKPRKMALYTLGKKLKVSLTLFWKTMLPHKRADWKTSWRLNATKPTWTGGRRALDSPAATAPNTPQSGSRTASTSAAVWTTTPSSHPSSVWIFHFSVILLLKRRHLKDVFTCRVQPGELHVGGAGGDAGAASWPCYAGISGTHKPCFCFTNSFV